MLRISLGMACAVLSSACATGPANTPIAVEPQARSAARGGCQAVDSSFALGSPVYTECGVERPAATRGRQPAPAFSPRAPHKECYSVVVTVVVDESGSTVPETARVARTNDTEFARSVLDVLPSWRYTPAQKEGMRVKQVVEIRETVAVRVVRSDRPMRSPPPTRPPSC